MKPLPAQNAASRAQPAPPWVDAGAVAASAACLSEDMEEGDEAPGAERVGGHTQIAMSPYFGKPDFSTLTADGAARERIDHVSVADILRNAAVFPPHSIFEGIKMATFGFDPDDDMTGSPTFRFRFREKAEETPAEEPAHGWVAEYHRRLCEAIERSCGAARSPWLLQSGGKDSTTLAIALAETRPETTCITYLGGREENEVESARDVARTLGLRHETLVCNPGRAYDRYLAVVDRMPLLSADFALLSYVDLATEIAESGGDAMIDGQGSDNYFGTPVGWQKRLLYQLAREIPVPRFLFELPVIQHAFTPCYMLGTLQMSRIERVFPGSRFTDAEVDELFASDISRKSRARLALFQEEVRSARTLNEWRDIALSIAGSTGGLAKGLYTAYALSLHAAYPFCDSEFGDWVYHQVPRHKRMDEARKINKVLVREHIATRFAELPYVRAKGSFRFDLCGLAVSRFETVYRYAAEEREVLPGAADWLRRNRKRLDNKYYASKFYLLAIVLPWIRLSRRGAL